MMEVTCIKLKQKSIESVSVDKSNTIRVEIKQLSIVTTQNLPVPDVWLLS